MCSSDLYTPELRFILDDGVRKSVEAAAIIREALEQDAALHGTVAVDDESESEDSEVGLTDSAGG